MSAELLEMTHTLFIFLKQIKKTYNIYSSETKYYKLQMIQK